MVTWDAVVVTDGVVSGQSVVGLSGIPDSVGAVLHDISERFDAGSRQDTTVFIL